MYIVVIILTITGLNTAFAQAPSFTYPPGNPHTYTTGTPIPPLLPNNAGGPVPANYYGQTTTLAGNGTDISANGTGTGAGIPNPIGIVVDAAGNLYVASWKLLLASYIYVYVKKITPQGVVTTYAGTGDQGYVEGSAAMFNIPEGMAIDASGNIYVADVNNNVIRKITPAGVVSTFAGSGTRGTDDGPATEATFNAPSSIAIDGTGNLFVADYSSNLIRKITPLGAVTTLAGGGTMGAYVDATGSAARFKNPKGLAVDNSGNVYVADAGNNLIRKVTSSGVVTTIAGTGIPGFENGAALSAQFKQPSDLDIDLGGNIYVSDAGNNMIRRVSSGGIVTTVAGQIAFGNANGTGTKASFHDPESITLDPQGNIYIGDTQNHLVRKIVTVGYSVSPALPAGLNFDVTSGIISGTPTTPTNGIKTYTITGYNTYGSYSTTVKIKVTGSTIVSIKKPAFTYQTPQVYKVNLTITPLKPKNTGGAVPAQLYGGVTTLAGKGPPGSEDNTGTLAGFNKPDGVAVDATGNVYVADALNNLIRKVTPAGIVTTIGGSGVFNHPAGIGVDRQGNVYVADAGNNLIRKITAGGAISIFKSGFTDPKGLAVDALGNVYVSDAGNTIKKITPLGAVSTFAGSGSAGSVNGVGTAASFNNPAGLAIDKAGYIYVSDTDNNLIRKITPGGLVSTLAGSGSPGSDDGSGIAASFKNPIGITVDAISNVYIGDKGNNLIRKITPSGAVTTLAGGPDNPAIPGHTFSEPRGIAVDTKGNLYVGDYTNNLIRKITTNGYTISSPLPAGLNFDGKTGFITGTPTEASAAKDYIITAYNTGGSSSFIVNITVQTPVVIVTDPPDISYVTPQNYILNTPIIRREPANSGGAVPETIYGQVSTFAGKPSSGSTNGTGMVARFSGLHAVATDLVGNVYLTDNNLIRKIRPDGVVTTLAGSSSAGFVNGSPIIARFNQPLGIAVDGTGVIYVADTKNNTIRMITQAGVVTTIAGTAGSAGLVNGAGAAAKFNAPYGITIDGFGNIYVADKGNNVIRKITPARVVSTFAGGSAGALLFNKPAGLSADQDDNIYVADAGNNLIKKITKTGVVSTLAGSGAAGFANGTGTAAKFNNPTSVSTDVVGNIYVADANNKRIRKITPAGKITTLAGSGATGAVNGALTAASFNQPFGVSIDIFGNLYIADLNNNMTRKIVTTGYTISGPLPEGLTFDGKTGFITGTPNKIWPTTVYTIVAYNTGGSSTAPPISITVAEKAAPGVDPPEITYPPVTNFKVNIAITPLKPTNRGGILPNKVFGKTTTFAGSGQAGSVNNKGILAQFNQPFGIATDILGNVYVADHQNNLIRKITPDGTVTTLAGSGSPGLADGIGIAASFNSPTGVAVDVTGNVYVADVSNNLIRKITPTGKVTTLAGNPSGGAADGKNAEASFNSPSGLAVDDAGNIYVADLLNNLIRKITPGGVVTTLAGSRFSGLADGIGTAASFNQPYGVAVDKTGNVYVADWGNSLIRKITPNGKVTTLAGSGTLGTTDGVGSKASFKNPVGLTIDEAGNIYVADTDNELIRKITPTGVVTTVAGNGDKGHTNGTGSETSFFQPAGITADGAGNVYIADESNNLIRQVVVVSNFTIDKQLPKGLIFNPTTGIISGKPTEKSPATTYTITAYNLGGSSTYSIRFAVDAAPLIITFNALPDKTYGDINFSTGATTTNSAIPITYTSSDANVAVVVNDNVHITGAGTTTITAKQEGNAAYISAVPITQEFTVNKAALTIIAEDKVRYVGASNPALTVIYTGFVYHDNVSQLTKLPVTTTVATLASPAGEYPIVPDDASSPNYTLTYLPGILTVNEIPPTIVAPNAFTPNGDGINDFWNIPSLSAYPDCTVAIYNRYGSLLYQSRGYAKPWDGTFNNSRLPSGTYYYIINPNNGTQSVAGSITIIL